MINCRLSIIIFQLLQNARYINSLYFPLLIDLQLQLPQGHIPKRFPSHLLEQKMTKESPTPYRRPPQPLHRGNKLRGAFRQSREYLACELPRPICQLLTKTLCWLFFRTTRRSSGLRLRLWQVESAKWQVKNISG